MPTLPGMAANRQTQAVLSGGMQIPAKRDALPHASSPPSRARLCPNAASPAMDVAKRISASTRLSRLHTEKPHVPLLGNPHDCCH